jgi:hypothetical protein
MTRVVYLRRSIEYERGRLHIEYLSRGATAKNRSALCLYNLGPLFWLESAERCVGRYADSGSHI